MMNYQNDTYRKDNRSQIPPTESPSYQGFLNTLVKGNDVILLDACTVMKGEPFEQLLKDLKRKDNIINKAKRLMKQQPDKAQEHMNNIRKKRAEAIKQINNYRKDE